MHVLLLTEDLADHALFQKSIENLPFAHSFTACESIAEAWAKLMSRQIPVPNLIFVDLELSRSYDHEIVQVLKSNPEFGVAPVVVVAETADQEDILNTYKLQVACFVVFPREREIRQKKIQACLEFWSTYAELPELHRWWGESHSNRTRFN